MLLLLTGGSGHVIRLSRPDGTGTVTVEEEQDFQAVRKRLMVLLENHITHFR